MIESIIKNVKQYDPLFDFNQITKAYEFSKKAHVNQTRASGDPFLEHPTQVANLLTQIKLDGASIVAGLLHDTVEDTNINIIQIILFKE